MRSLSKSPFKSNKGDIIPILDLNFENKKSKFKIKIHNNNNNIKGNSFIQKVAMSLNLK
jgi:hypothetical protein